MLVELGNTSKAIPYYALMRPEEKPVHFNGVFLSPDAFLVQLDAGEKTTPSGDPLQDSPRADRVSELPTEPAK